MAKNLVDGTSTNIEENGNNISIQINFPIGYIYMSTSSINPSTYFGGTWQRIAKGKTLVGVDENDTDFINSKLTGGEKSHTLTLSEAPIQTFTAKGESGPWNYANGKATATDAFSLLQPYFTCYIWEKVGV